MEYEQKTVTFDRLTIDPANARKKYDREALDVLKASILGHGIIEPLVVRPPQESDADLGGQLYRVFAGGRRFRALTELVMDGQASPLFEVPIIIREVEDKAAKELSLAENFAREPMTPAEEFRAFNDLIEAGETVEEVAARFGQTERYVRGRMALAKLHPEIFAAFEADKLTFATACAYTVNPDHDVQIKHFTDGGYYAKEAYAIRNAMRQAGINANSDIARFIGEDAYRDAGGIIHADLFGDEVMWTSGELIESLKAAALERHRAAALAEGWSFFATSEELGIADPWRLPREKPEGTGLTQAELERMDEISELLEGAMEDDPENEKLSEEYDALNERASTYTAEQKASLGIVIDMDQRVEVYFGVVKPETITDAGGEPLSAAAKASEKAAKDPLALTQPLKDKVGDAATAALHHAVQNSPHKALALLAASLQFSLRGGYTGGGRPTRVKVESVGYGSRDSKVVDIRKSYDDFAKMSPEKLLEAVAFMTADSVDLTEKWFQSDLTSDDVRQKTRLHFLNAFGATAHGAFSPSDWFSSCTKPQIEAAMKEMGGKTTAQKKAGMANDAATMATITGWLPKELRHKGYALKKPEKPAKARPARAKKEKAAAANEG